MRSSVTGFKRFFFFFLLAIWPLESGCFVISSDLGTAGERERGGGEERGQIERGEREGGGEGGREREWREGGKNKDNYFEKGLPSLCVHSSPLA